MSEHTPEPVEANAYGEVWAGKEFVADCFDSFPNAKHIAACWNACEGLNPKAVPELVKALKSAAIVLDLYDDRSAADCRAAIAKVEKR
jgi:hypothetical protein